MVDFNNPIKIEESKLAAMKFWHVLAGLYFWEFVTTLDFEWSAIRGHIPYRWTIWIYSVTRISTLMAVILTLVDVDVTARYNCHVEIVFHFFFGYLAVAAASLLIVLRIIAIWNGKRLVRAIAAGIWVANVGFLVQSVARVRGSSDCVIYIHTTKLNMITILITDIALLLIMLIGLLRLGFHEPGICGLGHLMWRQGLIWLFLATIAEVPPVVFICLNLNIPFDEIFQIPAMITLSIAATRIHRSLSDFSSRPTEMLFPTLEGQSDPTPASPPTLEPMEVAIHKTCETQQITQNTSLTITSDGILRNKPSLTV